MTFLSTHKLSSEEAYDKYADLLYRLALTHMQSKEDAEDAVQNVFIKFMRKTPSFRDEEHAKAWFVRVTINECRDALRKNSVRTYVPLDDILEHSVDDKDAHLAAEVMQTLAKLPEKYRTVIVLHFLEGYSVEEVAKTLHLSSSAVKMRIMRGKQMFKETV